MYKPHPKLSRMILEKISSKKALLQKKGGRLFADAVNNKLDKLDEI